MDYAEYQHLAFDRRPSGVVLVTINRPEAMNATNARLHWELTQVWLSAQKIRVPGGHPQPRPLSPRR